MAFQEPLKIGDKKPGDLLIHKEWNEVVGEVVRLEDDKVNKSGDTIMGVLELNAPLKIGCGVNYDNEVVITRDNLSNVPFIGIDSNEFLKVSLASGIVTGNDPKYYQFQIGHKEIQNLGIQKYSFFNQKFSVDSLGAAYISARLGIGAKLFPPPLGSGTEKLTISEGSEKIFSVESDGRVLVAGKLGIGATSFLDDNFDNKLEVDGHAKISKSLLIDWKNELVRGFSLKIENNNYSHAGSYYDSENTFWGLLCRISSINLKSPTAIEGDAWGENKKSKPIGLLGYADGKGEIHTGVKGLAMNASSENIGVKGRASGGIGINYGVSGEASGNGENRGIYGSASGEGGNYAGYFDSGDVYVKNILSVTGKINTDSSIYATKEILSYGGIEGTNSNRANIVNEKKIIGVYGNAVGYTAEGNCGVFGDATAMNAPRNIGVYGKAENGEVNYAGYFEGDVEIKDGKLYLYSSDSIVYKSSSKSSLSKAALTTPFKSLLSLTPRETHPPNQPTQIGYNFAEIEALGLKELLIYEGDQPTAVNYEKLCVYLLEIVRQHEAMLNPGAPELKRFMLAPTKDSTLEEIKLYLDINEIPYKPKDTKAKLLKKITQ